MPVTTSPTGASVVEEVKDASAPIKHFVVDGEPLKTIKRKVPGSLQHIGRIRLTDTDPNTFLAAVKRVSSPRIQAFEGHIPRRRDQYTLKYVGPLSKKELDTWIDDVNSIITEIQQAQSDEDPRRIKDASLDTGGSTSRASSRKSPTRYVNKASSGLRSH